jgi:hypothetical protein
MKKLIVWPENCVQGFEEVLKTEEPIYLHLTGYIAFALMFTVFLFVCFGKVDEKVRSSGLVRTEKNISCVKVYSGGEISSINYVPGQLVNAGEVLLRIDSGALEVEKNAYVIKETDCFLVIETVYYSISLVRRITSVTAFILIHIRKITFTVPGC